MSDGKVVTRSHLCRTKLNCTISIQHKTNKKGKDQKVSLHHIDSKINNKCWTKIVKIVEIMKETAHLITKKSIHVEYFRQRNGHR